MPPMLTVVYTPRHRIAGELSLRDERLSDFLNKRGESIIRLDNASISRASDPDAVLMQRATAVIHKRAALVVFGVESAPPAMSLYARVPKKSQEALLLVDTLEVRGRLHTTQALDVIEMQRLVTSQGSFMPVTDAVLSVDGAPEREVRETAVMVNIQHIRFIATAEEGA